MVGTQVAAGAGFQLVFWIYDKSKKLWKPNLEAAQPGERQQSSPASEMSPQRGRRIGEQFAGMSSEDEAWAQMGDTFITPPQQAQTTAQQQATSSTMAVVQPTQTVVASRQIQRVNAGQNMLPIDDYGNYDHNHDHDHDHNRLATRFDHDPATDARFEQRHR